MNPFGQLLLRHTSDAMTARQHALLAMVVAAGEMSAADPRLFPFCSIIEERGGLLAFTRTPSERGEDAVTVTPRPFGIAVAKMRASDTAPALRRTA